PRLLRELDAFQADIAVAGETEDVAQHFAARIVAAVFIVVVHALDFERGNLRRDLGRDRFLEIDEVLAVAQLRSERARVELEGRGKHLQFLWRSFDLVGPGPDRLHRRADRQRLAEAVENAAAMGGNLEVAAVTRRALLLQKLAIDRLQV